MVLNFVHRGSAAWLIASMFRETAENRIWSTEIVRLIATRGQTVCAVPTYNIYVSDNASGCCHSTP